MGGELPPFKRRHRKPPPPPSAEAIHRQLDRLAKQGIQIEDVPAQ